MWFLLGGKNVRSTIGDGHKRRFNCSGNMLFILFYGKFVSVHFIVTTTDLYFWPSNVTWLVVILVFDPFERGNKRFAISVSGESSMKANVWHWLENTRIKKTKTLPLLRFVTLMADFVPIFSFLLSQKVVSKILHKTPNTHSQSISVDKWNTTYLQAQFLSLTSLATFMPMSSGLPISPFIKAWKKYYSGQVINTEREACGFYLSLQLEFM